MYKNNSSPFNENKIKCENNHFIKKELDKKYFLIKKKDYQENINHNLNDKNLTNIMYSEYLPDILNISGYKGESSLILEFEREVEYLDKK